MALVTKAEIRKHAKKVFGYSMRRAGIRCPKWARTPEFERMFLRVYMKAAKYNLTGFRRKQNGCGWHVDHIEPLKGEKVCGLHVPWNLHVIPSVVNQAKSTLIVEEWHVRPSDVEYAKPRRSAKRERRELRERLRVAKARTPHLDELFR
jgi:hypothetical protein